MVVACQLRWTKRVARVHVKGDRLRPPVSNNCYLDHVAVDPRPLFEYFDVSFSVWRRLPFDVRDEITVMNHILFPPEKLPNLPIVVGNTNAAFCVLDFEKYKTRGRRNVENPTCSNHSHSQQLVSSNDRGHQGTPLRQLRIAPRNHGQVPLTDAQQSDVGSVRLGDDLGVVTRALQ